MSDDIEQTMPDLQTSNALRTQRNVALQFMVEHRGQMLHDGVLLGMLLLITALYSLVVSQSGDSYWLYVPLSLAIAYAIWCFIAAWRKYEQQKQIVRDRSHRLIAQGE